MIEHGKCSPDMRAALSDEGIFYCSIDEFNASRAQGLTEDALFREMYAYIGEHLHLNLQEMFRSALTATRVEMDEAAQKRFFDKHIRPFQASIDAGGSLIITLKK